MKKYFIMLILAVFALAGMGIYQFLAFNDGKLHIFICDVGQGDGIFIRTPQGSDIVIDGGPDQSILSCLSRNMPFWDRTIEEVILTHPDADHSTGITYVLERYKVINFNGEKVPGKTQIFKKLLSILAEKKMSARYLYPGDELKERDGLDLVTYWPSHAVVDEAMKDPARYYTKLNEFSVTELLEYGKFKALFTGDEAVEVGEKVASQVGDIDFLKVPHHGSKYGMSEIYLRNLRPELAAISVGAKNRYGHPAPYSLKLLRNADVKTLRTDLSGQIEVVSDGKSWWYKTQK